MHSTLCILLILTWIESSCFMREHSLIHENNLLYILLNPLTCYYFCHKNCTFFLHCTFVHLYYQFSFLISSGTSDQLIFFFEYGSFWFRGGSRTSQFGSCIEHYRSKIGIANRILKWWHIEVDYFANTGFVIQWFGEWYCQWCWYVARKWYFHFWGNYISREYIDKLYCCFLGCESGSSFIFRVL